eukprot:CAMPEP_0176181300 /NCGR_PEP_ID=MMETSP0120_2-20121206/92896_1 /TAXON_ID=160619 /ORGANISM="Kryptoperidinium foliaceum, Strain CCMP 1326" /LENGTH=197 /DNA_ID=CAMNT_0017519525 /DNA_START=103 /DNA_END=692 /DNA_ORIENTATION=-
MPRGPRLHLRGGWHREEGGALLLAIGPMCRVRGGFLRCVHRLERSGVFAEVRPAEISVDADSEADIDLLITEEGWGLSSANWLIRRSEWSIDFLDRAFRLCHEEMPLFGDQDAMIHLLLNAPALDGRSGSRAVDPHAALIPQHEINAYDALNAHYMQADAYTDGDLLITFPGCKEARSCNPLFRLAAAHGRGEQRDA